MISVSARRFPPRHPRYLSSTKLTFYYTPRTYSPPILTDILKMFGPSDNSKLKLLNMLRRKEKAIGTFSVLRGTRNAQVLAHTGVDAVMVDCEHGHVNDSDMHDMVSAISGSGISPLIRIRGDSPIAIKRALDTGAHGVMIPMVSSAAQARDIVRQCKFPPVGDRGQGSPFACFEFGLATPAEYVKAANESLLVIAQIETRGGIENIEEICQVDGIDMVIIGPNDLSLAMSGYQPPKPSDLHYYAAIDRVVEAAKQHGKYSGLVVTDGQTAKDALERFDFVILTNEVRAMQVWFKRELSVVR